MAGLFEQTPGKQEVSSAPITPVQKPLLSNALKMHALVWHGNKDIRYEEVPQPLLTDPRDVLVKVTASSICGTDCHLYSGSVPEMHSGDIVGHEFMGVISEAGTGVRNFKAGDRVVVAAVIVCGQCEFCKREEFSACAVTNPTSKQKEQMGQKLSAIFGFSHITGGIPGGQAEYVRVPYADANCLKLPDNVPDDKALLLSDIIPTSYFGVENAEIKKGDTVAIWGLGPVGMLACRWAQIKGAAKVIGIDNVPERLQRAQKALGIDVLNFNECDVVKQLTTLYPHGIDAGIECAGSEYAKSFTHKAEMALGLEQDTSDILTEIIQCVRPFGHISIVGVYVGTANHFPIGPFMQKGQTMRGGNVPLHGYWKTCLQYLQSGEFDPSFVITTHAPLSDGPKLYSDFYDKKKGIVKIILRPDNLPLNLPLHEMTYSKTPTKY